MAAPNRDAEGNRDIAPGFDRGSPRAPRWVRVFSLIAGVLFALFAVTHLLGGGLGHHRSFSAGSRHVPHAGSKTRLPSGAAQP